MLFRSTRPPPFQRLSTHTNKNAHRLHRFRCYSVRLILLMLRRNSIILLEIVSPLRFQFKRLDTSRTFQISREEIECTTFNFNHKGVHTPSYTAKGVRKYFCLTGTLCFCQCTVWRSIRLYKAFSRSCDYSYYNRRKTPLQGFYGVLRLFCI